MVEGLIGIIIGSIFFVGLVVFLVYLYWWLPNKDKNTKEKDYQFKQTMIHREQYLRQRVEQDVEMYQYKGE